MNDVMETLHDPREGLEMPAVVGKLPEGDEPSGSDAEPQDGGVGAILSAIAALGATGTSLFGLLVELSTKLHASVNRSCAVGVANHTKRRLSRPRFYCFSGSVKDQASAAEPGKCMGIATQKTRGGMRGSVGVIGYNIEGTDRQLVIMWSVPADYGSFSNWFKAAVVPSSVAVDYKLYRDMYYNYHDLTDGDAAKAGQYGEWRTRGFTVRGNMTNNSSAVMQLELHEN